MQTDCFYQRGGAHRHSEDYALSGRLGKLAYAIVCDGCSSSDWVEVGSRIMAHAAKAALADYWRHEGELGRWKRFGSFVLRRAARCLSLLGLDGSALDTTMAVAVSNGDHHRVLIHGDGGLILRSAETTRLVTLEYSQQLPYYLSYALCPQRNRCHRAYQQQKLMQIRDTNDGRLVEARRLPLHEPFTYVSDQRLLSLSVTSDGIGSGRLPGGESLPGSRVASAWTAFKSTKGRFLQRRWRAYEKSCRKRGITHEDDCSMATILFE